MLKIVLKLTKIIDKILKMTIILNFPSRVLGGILGLLEGIVVSFIVVFIMFSVNKTRNYVTTSRYGEDLLIKMPMANKVTKPVIKSYKEIIKIGKEYKDSEDRELANKEALDILLKYRIIDKKNAKYLVETGKIEISD